MKNEEETKMEKLENRKRILIWGTGVIGASKLLYEMLETRYEIIAYCDSDRTKWGTLINGCGEKFPGNHGIEPGRCL